MKTLHLQHGLVCLAVAIITMGSAESSSAQSTLFNRGTTTGGTTGGGAGGGSAAGQQFQNSSRGADVTIDTDTASQGVNTNFGTGFVGRSDNSGRFVGNQTAGQQGGSRGQQQFGNFGGSRANQFNSRNTRNQFGGSSSRRKIRARHVIGFSYKKRPKTMIQSSVTTRFSRLKRYPAISGIAIAMNDSGVLTLRGDVESESARKLAANLARLEPGVRNIQNELTVTVPPKE